MNFKCIICADLFVASADISTTTCGHLFHFSCLLQWLDRSKSCPQCRSKTTEKTIHRVYLSVDDQVTNLTDSAALQNQIDNLNFQLKMKSMDVENTKEKLRVSNEQTLGLRKEVKDVEDKSRVLESATHALRDQVKYFKTKSKEIDRLQEETVILKSKICELEHVQLVISGSKEQVNDMLRHNRDPNSLTVLVSTLKKELIDADRKKKQIQVMLNDTQNELQSKTRELIALSKQNTRLLQDLEAHKNCESERVYLKKKLNELKSASKSNESSTHHNKNTVNRILLESPVQLPQDKPFSPSLPEKIQAIKDSDSPYLRVQSSGVGLVELMHSSVHTNAKKPSIFKCPTLKIENHKRPSSFASYDGLGGHSRDQFTRSLDIRKRPKSTSTIPSAKLRKLAPQQKLDEFFNLSNESP